jgi:hypothetical protein
VRAYNASPEVHVEARDEKGDIVAVGDTLVEVARAAVGTSCRFYEVTTRLVGSDF